MKNIAVFASGRGSNFAAIIRAAKGKRINAKIALLICDNPDAGAIRHARNSGIEIALIERKHFPGTKDFEAEIIQRLNKAKIDLIVLAGFMRMLSVAFVRKYRNRIINIHPSLLPAFKGTEGIKDAFEYGVKVTGVTVHFVDEKMDHGAIILQSAVKIEEDDTLASLEAKIHKTEHRIYPEAIQLFITGKLKLNGRRVKINNR